MFQQLRNIFYALPAFLACCCNSNDTYLQATEKKVIADTSEIDTISTDKEEDDEYSKSMNIHTYILNQTVTDTSLIFETDIACAIFTNPTEKEIEEMKKEEGEDFYIVIDDVMYYKWQSSELLDTLNIRQFSTEKKYLKLIRQDGKIIFLNTRALQPSWNLFFFNPAKDPVVVSSADITHDYIKNYFGEN